MNDMELDLPYSCWDDKEVILTLDIMPVDSITHEMVLPEDLYWRAYFQLGPRTGPWTEIYWKGFRLTYAQP